MRRTIRFLLGGAALLVAVPSAAQQTTGAVAASSVGEVGQRQARPPLTVAAPTGRLDTRIQNRVASRLQNRIDRFYRSDASAASPFEEASDEARSAGRPRDR